MFRCVEGGKRDFRMRQVPVMVTKVLSRCACGVGGREGELREKCHH